MCHLIAGLVTTIVSPGEEEERLLQLAEELGIELEQVGGQHVRTPQILSCAQYLG